MQALLWSWLLTIGTGPAHVKRTVVRGLREQSSAGPMETLLSITGWPVPWDSFSGMGSEARAPGSGLRDDSGVHADPELLEVWSVVGGGRDLSPPHPDP